MSEAIASNGLFDQLVAHINDQSVNSETVVAVCDYCNDTISNGDRLSVYLSNTDITGQADPCPETGLHIHRVYCKGCDRKAIIYPNQGTKELLITTATDEDGDLVDWGREHSSHASHGEPWCPKSAYEFVFGGFEGFVDTASRYQQTVSHEDITDMIRLAGIGFRELFDEGGVIVAPESKRDDIQQRAASHSRIIHGDDVPELENQKSLRRQLGGFSCPECGAEAQHWDWLSHNPSCSSSARI